MRVPVFRQTLRVTTLALLLLGAVLSGHNGVRCWDKQGHEAVGMTAESGLSTTAKTQLRRLLNGRDVVDVSGWTHKVEQKLNETAAWHVQFQPDECNTGEISYSYCQDNQCLVPAAQHFYERLMGRKTVELEYPAGVRLTDADRLKFLIDLIGDIHMPLAFGHYSDSGGRRIVGSYKAATSLYDVWNSQIIQDQVTSRTSYWYGGWTHVNSLGRMQLDSQKRSWDAAAPEEKHKFFVKWANEARQLACSQAYTLGVAPDRKTFALQRSHDQFIWLRVRNQLLLAGSRLSIVLNDILKEKEIVRLRKGSGLEIPVDADEVNLKNGVLGKQVYLRPFLINMSIFATVLFVFIYLTKFYSPAASVSTPVRGSPSYAKNHRPEGKSF